MWEALVSLKLCIEAILHIELKQSYIEILELVPGVFAKLFWNFHQSLSGCSALVGNWQCIPVWRWYLPFWLETLNENCIAQWKSLTRSANILKISLLQYNMLEKLINYWCFTPNHEYHSRSNWGGGVHSSSYVLSESPLHSTKLF